jgi:hypothetical protein
METIDILLICSALISLCCISFFLLKIIFPNTIKEIGQFINLNFKLTKNKVANQESNQEIN